MALLWGHPVHQSGTKVRLKLQLYMQISCLELEGNPLKHTPPSEILSMASLTQQRPL